jgi:polyhydroxybutyrate depolymerase
MKKYFFILVFSLSFIFSALAQIKQGEITHDGYNRTWLTYIPKNYSKAKAYPLVIALHGGGGTAKQLMNSTKKRFNTLADTEGFIVVYPQGVKKSWNDNNKRDQNGFARKENIDDVGFIGKMISKLQSKYNINSDAVFACGISNGGLMSQTLAMELSEKIKVVGMVAATFGKDEVDKVTAASPFSILFIHGTKDPIIPYTEGDITVFKKTRGHVLGIEKSIAYMCSLNGNSLEPIVTKLANVSVKDNMTSEHLKYLNPENQSLKVELIKVINGGHSWPGAKKKKRLLKKITGATTQDFNACNKLWEFFKSTMN